MNVRLSDVPRLHRFGGSLAPIFDTVGTIASEVVHPDHINVGFEGE